jgi:hypothetical protein
MWTPFIRVHVRVLAALIVKKDPVYTCADGVRVLTALVVNKLGDKSSVYYQGMCDEPLSACLRDIEDDDFAQSMHQHNG